MRPTANDREKARMAAGKAKQKKLVFAVCLLGVMAVLWIKVFVSKKSPSKATAGTAASNPAGEKQSDSLHIVYKALPCVEGRNDILARDIFASKSWKGFKKPGQYGDGDVEPDTQSMDGSKITSTIGAVAKELELTAIVTGKERQAFIENKLLVKGDSFEFLFQQQKLKFIVLNIYDNKVELKCNGIVIVKKIPQPSLKTD